MGYKYRNTGDAMLTAYQYFEKYKTRSFRDLVKCLAKLH
jgi:hypothetical protein